MLNTVLSERLFLNFIFILLVKKLIKCILKRFQQILQTCKVLKPLFDEEFSNKVSAVSFGTHHEISTISCRSWSQTTPCDFVYLTSIYNVVYFTQVTYQIARITKRKCRIAMQLFPQRLTVISHWETIIYSAIFNNFIRRLGAFQYYLTKMSSILFYQRHILLFIVPRNAFSLLAQYIYLVYVF